MKQYHILKAFNGSQHGNDFAAFVAGQLLLSDDLARIALKEGWAEPVATGGIVNIEPKLVGETPSESILPEDRETKVVEPEETKPAKPKKHK